MFVQVSYFSTSFKKSDYKKERSQLETVSIDYILNVHITGIAKFSLKKKILITVQA